MTVLSSNPSSVVSAGTWTSGANVYSSNDVYATNIGTTQNTEYPLDVGGFAFSAIPAGSTINSVTVTIEAKTGTAARAQIKGELYDGTTLLSGALALTNLTAADANYTFTPTATLAQVKSANLLVRVTNKRIVSQASTTSVDYVKIDVDYSPPPPVLDQAAFRFFADGTETGSAALAAQNTAPAVDTSGGDVVLGLRVRVQEGGNGAVQATDDFQLQWERNASGTWSPVVSASPQALSDSYPSSNWSVSLALSGAEGRYGQTFLGDGRQLTRVGFYAESRAGAPVGTLRAELYALAGPALTDIPNPPPPLAVSTTTVSAPDVVVPSMLYFDFAPVLLVAGVPYAVAVYSDQWSLNSSIALRFGVDQTTPTHSGTRVAYQTATGWLASGTASDMIFEAYSSLLESTVAPFNSASLTDAAATTSRLTGGSGSFVAGKVSEDGLVDDLGWAQSNFTELLYSIKLIAADLAPSDTLRFRVLRNGVVLGTYSQVPTLTVGGGGGPVTYQAAGVVSLVSTVSGAVTSQQAASGLVAVLSAAAGAVTAQHAVSGITPIVSAASGDATVAAGAVTYQAAGVVPIVSTASGAVTAQVTGAAGIVPVLSSASGAATMRGVAAGVVPILSTASGAVTAQHVASGVVPLVSTTAGAVTATYVASGIVPIVSASVGDAIVVGGAVTHQAAGVVAIVSGSSGDASLRVTQQVAGIVPIVSSAAGAVTAQLRGAAGVVPVLSTAAGSVTARLPAAGVVPIVSAAAGAVTARLPVAGVTAIVSDAAGAITATHAAAGIVPIVSDAAGSVSPTGSASGTVPILSTAAGAVTATMNVSGTVAIVSGSSGDVTARHAVSGSVPVVSAAAGAATMRGAAAGVVPIASSTAGAVTAQHPVSGIVPILSSAAGDPTVVGAVVVWQAAGVVPIVSTTLGSVTSRQNASGVVPVLSGSSGAVSRSVAAAGLVAIISQVAGTVTKQSPASGVVAITSVAVGAASRSASASGTVVAVTTVVGSVTATHQASGTVVVVSGVVGSVSSSGDFAFPEYLSLKASGPRLGVVPLAPTMSVSAFSARYVLRRPDPSHPVASGPPILSGGVEPNEFSAAFSSAYDPTVE